jgi:hypothetical protein
MTTAVPNKSFPTESDCHTVRWLSITLKDPFGISIYSVTYEDSAFGLAYVMEQEGIESYDVPFGFNPALQYVLELTRR